MISSLRYHDSSANPEWRVDRVWWRFETWVSEIRRFPPGLTLNGLCSPHFSFLTSLSADAGRPAAAAARVRVAAAAQQLLPIFPGVLLKNVLCSLVGVLGSKFFTLLAVVVRRIPVVG